QIIKEGGASDGNDLDLLFSGRKTMSGVPIKSSVNADQTRVDFLDLSHWGRAVLKDIDFYEVNGNTVFPIYGASGGLAASYISRSSRKAAQATGTIWICSSAAARR